MEKIQRFWVVVAIAILSIAIVTATVIASNAYTNANRYNYMHSKLGDKDVIVRLDRVSGKGCISFYDFEKEMLLDRLEILRLRLCGTRTGKL